MLCRLALLSFRRRWGVLGLWIFALIAITTTSSRWSGDW